MRANSIGTNGIVSQKRAECRQFSNLSVVVMGLLALGYSTLSPVAAQSPEPCPPSDSVTEQSTTASDVDAGASDECAPGDASADNLPSLTVSQAFGAVVLHWNHFAGNDYGYEIYRDGLSYHSADPGQTVFVDRLANDGDSHNYAIWPVIIESDQIQNAIPSEFVYVQNSAWSTLDPADALRTADVQTIVNEMKNIDPEQRELVMAAIAGTVIEPESAAGDDEAVAEIDTDAQPANPESENSEDSVTVETEEGVAAETEGDTEQEIELEPQIDILTLVESVLSANSIVGQHASTLLLNRFLSQQGSDRQLPSVFDLDDFDPNSNLQHRLSVDAFANIRDSLMTLDFGQLEAESVNTSVVDSVVAILDLAESYGLTATTAVNPLFDESESDTDAALVETNQQLTPNVDAVQDEEPTDLAEAESQESSQAPAQMMLIDKDGNIRVDRTQNDNSQEQSTDPVSLSGHIESMKKKMDSIGQRMVLIGESSQSSTPDPESSDTSTPETMQLDQGQAQIANDQSGSVGTLLDLNVEPGQGFETLPLNQPIPSGDGDLLDLQGSESSDQLETLPVRSTQ